MRFDGEIAGKLKIRDKLFKKSRHCKIYKDARNDAQRIIKQKKPSKFEWVLDSIRIL